VGWGAAGARLPPEFVRAVRERSDIVAVIGEHVALRPSGRELVGLCPFHQERTPSFYVSRERQLFHCYGCQAGGDVISFVMRIRGASFADAVAELAQRAGLALPTAQPLTAAQRRRLQEQAAARAACEAAAAFYQRCLRSPQAEAAIAYLKGRGVDGPTAVRFGLGYAPEGWDSLVRALAPHFGGEVLEAAGLAVRRPGGGGWYDRFRQRIIFPIWDERGQVVAFGGRALDPAGILLGNGAWE